jgi:hypothetical protein
MQNRKNVLSVSLHRPGHQDSLYNPRPWAAAVPGCGLGQRCEELHPRRTIEDFFLSVDAECATFFADGADSAGHDIIILWFAGIVDKRDSDLVQVRMLVIPEQRFGSRNAFPNRRALCGIEFDRNTIFD